MRLLIIDDNEEITTMLSKYFKICGHDCVSSNDGTTGLNMMKSGEYDVILLDLAMPEFSGIDLIKNLVEKKEILNYKIVVFTASHLANSEAEELIKKYTYGCVNKPIDPDELERYLNTIISQKRTIVQVN